MEVVAEYHRTNRPLLMKSWASNDEHAKSQNSARNLDLYRDIVAGNDRALNGILQENELMLRKIAHRYAKLGFSIPELVQEGRIGYLKGIQKFDETRGTSLNTYASWWAFSAVSRYVRREIRIRKASYSFDQLTNRELDEPKRTERFEDPSDVRRPSQELMAMMTAEVSNIRTSIQCLTERERFVLQRHYGFDDPLGPWTLQEIGDYFGFTRENTRQIILKALKKMRVSKVRFELIASGLNAYFGSL